MEQRKEEEEHNDDDSDAKNSRKETLKENLKFEIKEQGIKGIRKKNRWRTRIVAENKYTLE